MDLNFRVTIPVIALPLLLLTSQTAFAGAWTLPEGKSYHKVAGNFFTADENFGQDPAGFGEFTDYTLNYYGEFGLTDKLTFITQLPIRRSESEAFGSTVSNTGVGDVDLGLRYNFLSSDWVVSGQFLYKAPFLYDENDALPLGNGQSDFEFRLQLGRSLHPYGYFGLEVGYRFRDDDPSDEIRYLAEYGFDLNENIYLRTKLDVIQAVDSTDIQLSATGNPNFPNAFDLGRIEGSIGYKFGGRSAVEFTFTESLFGENSLDGQTYQLGIVYAL